MSSNLSQLLTIQEEQFHRKAEALKVKAQHEQRLLEDNMLMAERAAQARLSEERIRKEVESERRKLMEERRAVEAWRRKYVPHCDYIVYLSFFIPLILVPL